jgi:hypothetical protein
VFVCVCVCVCVCVPSRHSLPGSFLVLFVVGLEDLVMAEVSPQVWVLDIESSGFAFWGSEPLLHARPCAGAGTLAVSRQRWAHFRVKGT